MGIVGMPTGAIWAPIINTRKPGGDADVKTDEPCDLPSLDDGTGGMVRNLSTLLCRSGTYQSVDKQKAMALKVTKVTDFLGETDHNSWLLLRYYGFNEGRVERDMVDGKLEAVKDKLGIVDKVEVTHKPGDTYYDVVLMEEVKYSNCDWLDCGHAIHKDSWADMLSAAVIEKECTSTKCPHVDWSTNKRCKCIVSDIMWQKYTSGKKHVCVRKDEHGKITRAEIPDVYKRYRYFVEKEYVSLSTEMFTCPKCTECTMQFLGGDVPDEVTCLLANCRFEVCPKCENDPHFPSPCSVTTRWLEMATDQAATISYIMKELKAALCPKCSSPNERITGCNHMKCGQDTHGAKKGDFGCGTEFCYQCGDLWQQNKCGGYSCRNPRISTNWDKANPDAAKLDQYYKLWKTNTDDVKAVIKNQEQTKARLDELTKDSKGYHWSKGEVETILNSMSVILEARKRLAWTFAMGYYIPKAAAVADLFDDQQKQLTQYTNSLHQIIQLQIIGVHSTVERHIRIDKSQIKNMHTDDYHNMYRTRTLIRAVS